MILKRISKIFGALIVAASLSLTSLAPATAAQPVTAKQTAAAQTSGNFDGPELREPAGQYYSFCTNLGMSFNWTGNDPMTCPGYLDVYIGGQQTAHLNIGGSPGSLLWSCALGVGVSMVSIFVPGGPPVGWALVGALSSMGIALAGCAGW